MLSSADNEDAKLSAWPTYESDLDATGDIQDQDQENCVQPAKLSPVASSSVRRARELQERLRTSSEARGTLTELLDQADEEAQACCPGTAAFPCRPVAFGVHCAVAMTRFVAFTA
jgi:hypothetical protein